MRLSGDEVDRAAAFRVEVRGIRLVVDIDRDEHTLAVRTPLPDALPVGEDELTEVAVAQCAALAVRLRHRGDGVGQRVPLRRVERGAQRVVALLLVSLRAPFAAVIDARNARHAEEQRVDEGQMAAVLEDGRDARHIMVVDEREQMFAAVQRPVFRAELAQQGVGDLEQIVAVHRGIQTLVALVIRAGVQQTVPDELIVVAVQQFADEEEIRAERVAERAELTEKILVEAVGDVQPQTVDAEFLLPQADAVEQMMHDVGIAQIELYQLVVSFPALVPEAVVIVRIALERDVEPVLVGRVPFFLLYVPERPEAAADMVEHAVQHDLDAVLMQSLAYGCEIGVRAEAAVHLSEVAGIVAVTVGFEDRGEINGVAAETRDVLGPVGSLADARHGYAVVDARRAAEADGIDLIKNTFISPHRSLLLYTGDIFSINKIDNRCNSKTVKTVQND